MFTHTGRRTLATQGVHVGEIDRAYCICESTTTYGCVVVCDYFHHRIQEFSLNESRPPRVVNAMRFQGYPRGIAPCGDGTSDYIVTFYVSQHAQRISGVDGSAVWTAGSKGVGFDNFHDPANVVVLPDGQAVVSDVENSRLQVLDIHTGRFVKQIP